MLDSRYFTLAVPLINFILLPIAHGLLKRRLLKMQSTSGLESLVGLITTQDRAEKLIAELQRDWSKHISGVAILEAPASDVGSTLAGVKVTANYDNFMDWLRQAALDLRRYPDGQRRVVHPRAGRDGEHGSDRAFPPAAA